MADNAIASGAVVLTASLDGLAAGLTKATTMVTKWAGGAALGIGTAVVGMAEKAFEKMGELGAIKKQADALGVSASEFQGLTHVMERAGIAGNQTGQIFATMGKQIADVASGHGKGAKLAFEALGLDAAKLMEMKPDQQFLAIAEAFKKMGPGAQSASAAVHLFGGNAASLLPWLNKGAAGLEGYIAHLKKMGVVLGDDQLAAAGKAAKAWKEAKRDISEAWEGMVNKSAVALAPIVTQGAHVIEKVFTLLSPIIDWQTRAYGRIFEVGGKLFAELSHGAEELWHDLSKVLEATGEMGVEFPTVETVVVKTFKYSAMAIGYTWDALYAGAGVIAFVGGKFVEGFGAILDAIQKTTLAASDLAYKSGLNEMGDRLGLGAEKIAGWATEVKGLGKGIADWGLDAVMDFGMTADRWGGFFDGLTFEAEKAAHDAAPVMAKVFSDEMGMAFQPFKFAGAIERGSKEAYSLSIGNTGSIDHNKENGKKLDRVNEQLKQLNKNIKALDDEGEI